MPVQFNQLNLPAIDQAVQRRDANALALQEAEKQAGRQDTEYDEQQKLKNTRWLAASTKLLLELNQQSPDRFYEAADELGKVGIERGILDPENFDPKMATPETVQELHDAAMVGLGANRLRPDNADSRVAKTWINPDTQTMWAMSRDGQPFDTGVAAQQYGLRPIETAEGQVPFDPGRGGAVGPVIKGTEAEAVRQREARDIAATKTAGKTAEMTVTKEFDQERVVDSALTQLNKALRLAPVIRRARDQANWNNTGFMSLFNFIPGLSGNNLEADIQTIKANLGFGELAEMRATSKTGGAVGQLSDRELTVLSSMLRNLDTSQTYEQLQANIGDVLVQYEKWADAYGKEIAQITAKDPDKYRSQFQEYYDALEPGSWYYHPNGRRIRKQK